jgi:hypothetical protein
MADSANDGSARSADTAGDGAPRESPGHVCNVAFCPIGLALTAAEQVQPEVVSHLLLAGREFFLAAKAVMDARAQDLEGEPAATGPTRMEHIDIA